MCPVDDIQQRKCVCLRILLPSQVSFLSYFTHDIIDFETLFPLIISSVIVIIPDLTFPSSIKSYLVSRKDWRREGDTMNTQRVCRDIPHTLMMWVYRDQEDTRGFSVQLFDNWVFCIIFLWFRITLWLVWLERENGQEESTRGHSRRIYSTLPMSNTQCSMVSEDDTSTNGVFVSNNLVETTIVAKNNKYVHQDMVAWFSIVIWEFADKNEERLLSTTVFRSHDYVGYSVKMGRWAVTGFVEYLSQF